MLNFSQSFDYFNEEIKTTEVLNHPFIKLHNTEEFKINCPYYRDTCYNDRLTIIKAIKEFKMDFLKGNKLVNEAQYLKEVCMMFLKSIEFKSLCLKKHIIAVSVYSGELAKKLNLSDEQINKIEIGGLLHDVGKMSFPDYIFYKQGKLNDRDLLEIEKHPHIGYSIIVGTLSEEYEDLAQIALYHHEKWNGTGYPKQLKGKEIPIGARIVSICDSFDSMVRRKYFGQKVKTMREALFELMENESGQWDPYLANLFVEIMSADNYALYKRVKGMN